MQKLKIKKEMEFIKNYLADHSLIESNINSFNKFIDIDLPKLISELGEIRPTIIPHYLDDYYIKFGKIKVEKPKLVEADGSISRIYPSDARLRNLDYTIELYVNVSTYGNGTQIETFDVPLVTLPVMVKSKYCNLSGLNKQELVEVGEDDNDPGGYFVLNGNERVLIIIEDFALNKYIVQNSGKNLRGRLYSSGGGYGITHVIEDDSLGIVNTSFGRFDTIPFAIIMKALGVTKDNEINQLVSNGEEFNDLFINLYQASSMKTQDDALEWLANHIGYAQYEDKIQRTKDNLSRFFLPHVGLGEDFNKLKAQNLAKCVRKMLLIREGKAKVDDIDHYMNKRLKLSGDMLVDLFRVHLRTLMSDIIYNFQRLVKRNKFTSIRTIIRSKLLTQRVTSAMSTGNWVAERRGVTQNLDRTNFMAAISHLQRVVSPLDASQENFNARALHGTHWGRLCPVETPEGTNIGLRKNLALLTRISDEHVDEDKILKRLKTLGLDVYNGVLKE